MVGVGSDGTSGNKSIYALEKSTVGNHLVFSWCLSHKLELVLNDAFNDSHLEKWTQTQLESEHYLLKKGISSGVYSDDTLK